MIQQWTLPLLTGRKVRPRMIYVYVPDQRDDNSRFPVLYMFDGHNVFFDEDATGLSGIAVQENWNDQPVYDLRGQRVTTPKKGLYLINGKKVFVK
jgi:predicted alpha/beta superfamily hydrolase